MRGCPFQGPPHGPLHLHGSTVHVRDAVKVYGSGSTQVRAVDHIDVDIPAGEFAAIMGPSGSGKSTLLHCMAGLDRLTEGTVTIAGTELGALNDKQLTVLRREQVGFVFQAYNLVPDPGRDGPTSRCPSTSPAARSTRRGSTRSSRCSGWRTGSTTAPRSSPAASSSAWPPPARW